MEMHLFVAMVVKMFDLELQNPMPQAVSYMLASLHIHKGHSKPGSL